MNESVRSVGGRLLVAAIFGIAFLAAVLLSLAVEVPVMQKMLAPGVVLCLHSVDSFLKKGGNWITPSSALSFAILVFAGFPSIFVGLGLYVTERQPTEFGVLFAVTLCFVLQSCVYVFGASVSPISRLNHWDASKLALARRGRVLWLLFAVIAFGAALYASSREMATIAPGLGFGAILFAAIGAFAYRGLKPGIASCVILGAILIGYVELVFDGFGRLTLAVLAMCVGICASVYIDRPWLKWAALLAVGPALVYMSVDRLNYLELVRGAAASSQEGIGSVVGPIISSAHIIDAMHQGSISPTLGATFVAALLVWIPRSVWPEKPVGFGVEIVPVTQPNLVGAVGYSDAALITGEMVWNFGLEFAIVGIVLVAALASVLDRMFARYSSGITDFRSRLQYSIVVLLAASILNLFWGGLFTMTSRSLLILVFLVAVLVVTFRKPEVRSPDSLRSDSAAWHVPAAGKLK